MEEFTLIGQKIGKYQIVERLGRGGMAEVYKGYDENLERFVAIKVMHPFLASEGDFIGRFRREAKAMAALNHSNIVKVYDFDTTGERSYIVMEYLSQGTLKDKLEELSRKGQRLSLAEAIQIVLQVTNALAFAHSRGMIHRDIKPPNIMFNDQGAAILSDFGIAKVVSGPSFTQTGAMIGSPAYMSPEQGLGKPGDERSDIYSLGVLFFQLVTGQLPYAADTPLAVVLKHVNEPVPDPNQLNPKIPDGIRSVITKAMAKEPEERYQTAKAMADDLREVLRSADASLLNALPAELLKDQPTPPPLSGVVTDSGARPPLEKTQVFVPSERTVVSKSDGTAPVPPVVSETSGRKPPWTIIAVVGVIVLLLLAVGAGVALSGAFGGDDETPTPTSEIAVVVNDTPTATPTEAADEATLTPTIDEPTLELTSTESAPDEPTITPTLAPTSTSTSTPDATATQMAVCAANPGLDVDNIYTYTNTQSQIAPVGTSVMRLNIVLENTSAFDCVWPEQLQIVVVEGETFGLNEPFEFTAGLAPGESTTVAITGLDTPNRVATFEATWQIQTLAGEPFGDPITFEIRTFVPATATPTAPTATPTPNVTATPAQALNFSWAISSCEYPGGYETAQDYRCILHITPSGGSGRYTIEVFDANPPIRYENRTSGVSHYFTGRRCFPWINEVNVIDEGTGQKISQNIYFDPTTGPYFPNGEVCKVFGQT